MGKLTMSLIIPAYNEEKYIWSCLEYALRNGKWYFHEIIVIDNNSSDATKKVVEKYPEVKVFSEIKKWTSSARQRWYLESTGDILAFVDADTRMPAWWAKKIEDTFLRNKKVWVICGPYSYYDLHLPRYGFLYSWLYYSPILAYVMSKVVGGICTGGNFAMRRTVLDQIKWFDTDIAFYGDEADLLKRAKKHTQSRYVIGMKMPTSARRYKHQWILKTGYLYMRHVFKPAKTPVADYR